jgi:undecaprenol kinase
MHISFRTLKRSMQYAWKGLRYTFKNEQNFRLQVWIAVVVIILMIALPVSQLEAVALIFVISAVLILEILNTVVERFIDLLKPRLHHYSEIIKDMMAAAVLLTSLVSAAVGILIFYPYIAELLLK